jgi:hypothetical protein
MRHRSRFEHRDQRHVRRRNDGGGAPPAGEHRDLPEHIARPEGAEHGVVVDDFGVPTQDRERAVPEIPLAHESRPGIHRELRARLRNGRALIERQACEQRDRVEACGVHVRDASRPAVDRW